jgi:mono/diheme cytochrome c family protein
MASPLPAFAPLLHDASAGLKASAGHRRAAHIRRALWGLAALTASAMAGCAALEPLNPDTNVSLVETGRTLAINECSTCHTVGAGGGYPATGAPSFASVAERYRNYRLDWELETISQVGHYRMPAKMLTSPEISALAAYIRTLDSAKPSEASTPR